MPLTKTKNVLIVEDDPFIRDILAQKFKKKDWEVKVAGDGLSGFKEATLNVPDIIILDILLPGMDGHELLEKLKDDPALHSIPVLVLSNFDEKSDIEKSVHLGAVDHLVKANVILDEVVTRAEEVLKK